MTPSNARWILLLAATLLLPGCLAVAAGAAAGYGTAQYVRNDASRDYSAPLAVVWSAALASMNEAGYPVALDTPHQGTTGFVEVNDAELKAAQLDSGGTRVTITIGTFTTAAHRAMSERIHAGIQRRLPPSAPSAP